MSGRHARWMTRSRKVAAAVFGMVALVALAVWLRPDEAGEMTGSGCGSPRDVTVAVAPELAEPLRAVGETVTDAGEDECVNYDIVSQEPADAAGALTDGEADVPDLWIPDHSSWLTQVRDSQNAPQLDVIAESAASSPLVLVGPADAVRGQSSWLDVLDESRVAMLDPLSTGVATLGAVETEREATQVSEERSADVLVPFAREYAARNADDTDVDRLLDRAAEPGSQLVVVTSEHRYVAYQREHPDSELAVEVPDTGSLMFDYPLVLTVPEGEHRPGVRKAGQLLATELGADDRSLTTAGLRGADAAPLADGQGVGRIADRLDGGPDVLADARRQWRTLTQSTRALAVFDVSGSMNFDDDTDQTRMELAVDAAATALGLFPDNAEVGLWSFADEAEFEGTGEDWEELVPIRQLSAEDEVSAQPQRDVVQGEIDGLSPIVGASTGLYDTTLAAFRRMQEEYDPRAVNTVLLFTDGENDDPVSISRDELLSTLEEEQRAQRQVRIIAIGIGPDADIEALRQIADATGGGSRVADDSDDIEQVVLEAIQGR